MFCLGFVKERFENRLLPSNCRMAKKLLLSCNGLVSTFRVVTADLLLMMLSLLDCTKMRC